MRDLFVVTALLCLISVSVVSEFHTEEVRPGGEVTLRCSNFSKVPDHIFWFKLDNRANISRICSMIFSNHNASFYDGYNKGRFDLTSNTTTLFLNIKQVDLSDSGLYFCGHHCQEKPFIVSATYLKVQEDGRASPVMLVALIFFLIIVVTGMAATINKLHKADEEQSPHWTETLDSDGLKVAALSLYSAAMRRRRPESERETETGVVYTANRDSQH